MQLLFLFLSVHTTNRVLCGYGISTTSKSVFKPKKKLFQYFFTTKSSFRVPASATPYEVGCKMKDW